MSNTMSVPMVLSPIFLPDKKMKVHKCHSTLPKTKPHRDLNLLESFAFKNCLQKLHKDLKQPEKKKVKVETKTPPTGLEPAIFGYLVLTRHIRVGGRRLIH